jgi:DNA repair protein RecN (Recombination protein N)
MLSRLSIQNYAIIDRLEVDFSSQLNIITGETGRQIARLEERIYKI